jgi:hypothetical protein
VNVIRTLIDKTWAAAVAVAVAALLVSAPSLASSTGSDCLENRVQDRICPV